MPTSIIAATVRRRTGSRVCVVNGEAQYWVGGEGLGVTDCKMSISRAQVGTAVTKAPHTQMAMFRNPKAPSLGVIRIGQGLVYLRRREKRWWALVFRASEPFSISGSRGRVNR